MKGNNNDSKKYKVGKMAVCCKKRVVWMYIVRHSILTLREMPMRDMKPPPDLTFEGACVVPLTGIANMDCVSDTAATAAVVCGAISVSLFRRFGMTVSLFQYEIFSQLGYSSAKYSVSRDIPVQKFSHTKYMQSVHRQPF